MKHCVQFPDDKFLAVRPCLIAICMGNRPAGKLLNVFIDHYNQEPFLSIYRTEEELLSDLCGEIGTKTLQNVAIPTLEAFGYLSVEQKNHYVLHIDQIMQALAHKKGEIVNLKSWEDLQESVLEKIVKQNLHRAKKRHLPATLLVHQWHITVSHFDGKCAYCKERSYQVLEHVIPLSDKNSPGTVWSNCVPACYPCNTHNKKLQQPGLVDALAYLEKCREKE